MNRWLRRSLSILASIGCLASTALNSRADWTQALMSGPRGMRESNVIGDGAGGALLRWVTLEGQIYSAAPAVGHVDAAGAGPAQWPTMQYHATWSFDYSDIAPDGTGGAYVVEAEGSGIVAHHFASNGSPFPGWPDIAVAVSGSAGYPNWPRAAPDGAGGVFITWEGEIDTGGAAYLQHLTADGSIVPGWPAGGLRLAAWPVNSGSPPWIAPDHSGGVIVALAGISVRLFHLTTGSLSAAGWPDSGVVISTTSNGSAPLQVAVAGDDAVFVAWTEGGSYYVPLRSLPVRVVRVTPQGLWDSRWPSSGLTFPPGTSRFSSPAVCRDGTSGLYLVWGSRSSSGARSLRGVRIQNDGTIAPGWAGDGSNLAGLGTSVALDTTDFEFAHPGVIAVGEDGAGGLFLAWDDRGATAWPQVRVARFLPDGLRHPRWTAAGRSIPSPSGVGCSHSIVGAENGDAFVVWWESLGEPFGNAMLSRVAPDVTVDVGPDPARPRLAIACASANPVRGPLRVTCSLPNAGRGRLEIFDASGRREADVAIDGPVSAQPIRIDEAGGWTPGVRFARLSQGHEQRWLKFVLAP